MSDAAAFGALAAQSLIKGRAILARAQQCGTEAAWQDVLACPDFWSLRHEDGFYSVRNMEDKELQASVLEDLLFVAVETVRGAATSYPRSQAFRHLGLAQEEIPRIQAAIQAVAAAGYVTFTDQDGILINPAKLEEAQAFAGVFMLQWNAETKDWVDAMNEAGGEALLGDSIADILADIEEAKLVTPKP